jgi:hypothetical protein
VIVGTCSPVQVDPTGGGGVATQTGFLHEMVVALLILPLKGTVRGIYRYLSAQRPVLRMHVPSGA